MTTTVITRLASIALATVTHAYAIVTRKVQMVTPALMPLKSMKVVGRGKDVVGIFGAHVAIARRKTHTESLSGLLSEENIKDIM